MPENAAGLYIVKDSDQNLSQESGRPLPYDPAILQYGNVGRSFDPAAGSMAFADLENGLLGVIEAPQAQTEVIERQMREIVRDGGFDENNPASSLYAATREARRKALDSRKLFAQAHSLGATAVFAKLHREPSGSTAATIRNLGDGKSFLWSEDDSVQLLTTGGDRDAARTVPLRAGDRLVLTTAATAVDKVLVRDPRSGNMGTAASISLEAFERARAAADPQSAADILRTAGGPGAAVLVAQMPGGRREATVVATDSSRVGRSGLLKRAIGAVVAGKAAKAAVDGTRRRKRDPDQPGMFKQWVQDYKSTRDVQVDPDAPGARMGRFGAAGIATGQIFSSWRDKRRKRYIEKRWNDPRYQGADWDDTRRQTVLEEEYGTYRTNSRYRLLGGLLLAGLAYKLSFDPGQDSIIPDFGLRREDKGIDLLGDYTWPWENGDQNQGDGRGFDLDPFNRYKPMTLNDDNWVPNPKDIPTNNDFDIIPIWDGDGIQIGHRPIWGFSINDIPNVDKNKNGVPDIFEPGKQRPPSDGSAAPSTGPEPTTEPKPTTEPQPPTGGTPDGGQPAGEEARLRTAASQPFVVEVDSGIIKEIDELGDRLGVPLTREQASHIYHNMPESLRSSAVNLPGHPGADMYPGQTVGDWRVSAPDARAMFSTPAVNYLVGAIQNYN